MALEDQLWRIARDEVQAGRRVVLATVVDGVGSTPRERGARMLMGESGLLAGTVGGGCGESEVQVACRKLLGGFDLPSAIVDVDLSGDFEQDVIQACGGTMRVGVQLLFASDEGTLNAIAAAESGGQSLLVECNFGNTSSLRVIESPTAAEATDAPVQAALAERPRLHVDSAGDARFVAQVGLVYEVVIVGSGHVAQPLSQIARLMGYRVRVLDDRSSYVTAERFPGASELSVGSHRELIAALPAHPLRAVVIITRGHQHDEASLRAALSLDPQPFYVGMIGSRRRAIGTLQRLKADGFANSTLAAVHSPIGLDIGALTPEEIAVAIMAEITLRRRGGSGRPLRELRPGVPGLAP